MQVQRPSVALAVSFADMRDAFLSARDDRWTGVEKLAHHDPIAYVAMLCGWSEGKSLPEGWVPADAFWLVGGNKVVGQCVVRHQLTPQLKRIGGHIGYLVHPAHRNRGIATFALREALKVLAAKGVAEALLTCAESNGASARVIEKCGGRRIADSSHRRYLIPLAP
jgi:predicted acetyltransferase